MKKNHLFFIFSLALVVGFVPQHVFSALSATITLDPSNPTPNSPVTLTLVSYSFDVNQSTITWSSNGRELAKGLGEKRLSVNTGNAGTSLPIHVVAITETGESIGIDINIIPESVSILYESDESYVPLFYEGLALPATGSPIKFVAMPTISVGGTLVPPSQLSYLWYVDGTFVDKSSGIGRQVAYFTPSILTTKTDVRVVVRGPTNISAEKRITVYPRAVLPLLYVYDDVFGVRLNNQVTKRFETTRNFTISFEPLYLSTKGLQGSSLLYEWLLDGETVTPSGGRLLEFRPKVDAYGSNQLSVSVSNNIRRSQKARVGVDLIFDTRK